MFYSKVKKKMSLKDTIRQLLNAFILLFSLCGFMYQASTAVDQYLKYDTISFIKFQEESILDYPGVTFCGDELVADKTLFKWYPEYECIKNNPNCTQGMNLRHLNHIQLHNHFAELAYIERPIIELLEPTHHPQRCHLEMAPLSMNLTGQYGRYICESVIPVIESLSFSLNSRCYTYFSRLNQRELIDRNGFKTLKHRRTRGRGERKIKEFEAPGKSSMLVEIYSSLYKKKEPNHLFDYTIKPKKQPFFTIHAPDHIPGSETFEKLGVLEEMWYKIYFSRTVSHLLKAPYKTNCRDYDLGNKNASQSQQECYQSCVLNWYRKKCECIPRLQFPLSRENLEPTDVLCFDGIMDQCYDGEMREKALQMMKNCSSQCLPNCVHQTYSFESEPFFPDCGRNILTLLYSKEPDRVFVHVPEVTLSQLVCNVASSAGLWFGLSVMFVSDLFIDWVSSLYFKYSKDMIII